MVLFRLSEKIFVVFSIVFLNNVIVVLLNGGKAPTSMDSNTIIKVLAYGIQAFTILLLVVWHKKVIRTLIREKFLWVLVGLALASAVWSNVPSTTLSSSTSMLRITLFGVYFGARYSLKEQLQLLAWALGIGAVLSLLFVLAVPSYGVMGRSSLLTSEDIAHAGAWQGVYGHKNVLGRAMVLTALVFFVVANSSRRYPWVGWAGFVLSVVLIVGSTSKSALVVLMTILAVLPFYRALRWNYTLAVPFFITVILLGGSVALVLVGNAEDILGAFGRDLTLTGRTDLWAAVLDKIGERPWLGYGYGGFWLGKSGESAEVWSRVRWEPPHSHNGFLDLGLDLGLVGLLVFALSALAVCLKAVSWLRQTKTAEGLWPLAYLTFLLLYNLTESSFFRQNFLWILYVAMTLSLHNRSDNLVELKAFSKQKGKGEAMKQITSNLGGERA